MRPSYGLCANCSQYAPDGFVVRSGRQPKGTFEFKTVMLLSHGWEVEQVERDRGAIDRRSWLAAPLATLERMQCQDADRERAKIDSRTSSICDRCSTTIMSGILIFCKITPVQCRYFLSAKKLFSLTWTARAALCSSLGVFFSGFAHWHGPIVAVAALQSRNRWQQVRRAIPR